MSPSPLPPEIAQACRRVIVDWDLEDLIDPVLAATSATLLCERKDQAKRSAAPIGSTKLGGLPDLPFGVEWPKFNGRYLPFLAQVNLAELPPLAGNPLPQMGRIYYFYRCTNEVGQKPAAVVWLTADTTDLTRREATRDQILVDWQGQSLYEEDTATRFSVGVTVSLPLAEQLAQESGMGEIDLEDKWEGFADEYQQEVSIRLEYGLDVWERLHAEEGIETENLTLIELLGYPDPNNLFLHDFKPARGGHTDGKELWHNILYINSHNNMLWSDEGSLAFFVRDSDLRRGDFTRVRVDVMSS